MSTFESLYRVQECIPIPMVDPEASRYPLNLSCRLSLITHSSKVSLKLKQLLCLLFSYSKNLPDTYVSIKRIKFHITMVILGGKAGLTAWDIQMKMFIMARSILHTGPDDPSNVKGHFHFFKMAFTTLGKTTSIETYP